MHGYDIRTWAVSPAGDDDYYFAAAAVGGAGALTLLNTSIKPAGVGYKVKIDSAGDSSGTSWTIVGHALGTKPGVVTTETVASPNATSTLSTNYYDTITSITASAAMTGNQTLGTDATTVAITGTCFLGIYFVASTSAGSLAAARNSATGHSFFNITVPAVAANANGTGYVYLGRIAIAGSAASTDFAVVTPTNLTAYTLICG